MEFRDIVFGGDFGGGGGGMTGEVAPEEPPTRGREGGEGQKEKEET